MKKLAFIFVLLFFCMNIIFAIDGKLLIVGGGGEYSTEYAWNVQAYQWAVNQAQNKKVAIITHQAQPSDESWLINYFTQLGAVNVQVFNISSRSIADQQTTYDNLIMNDMVFFKGGDQYNYYSYYKATKTQAAVEHIFSNNGVICGTSAGMAILSDVIFTAEDGTVYPDECMQNPNNQYIVMADDFLNLVNGFVFDTHFAERGRMARLVGFMAHWKLNHNQDLVGIGIDDQTALAIDNNLLATVYGTGAANIYKMTNNETFTLSGSKLLTDSLQMTQLLQNCTIDLNTGQTTGLNNFVQPLITSETGNYTILASAQDALDKNNDMLSHLVNETGSIDDNVLIITGQNTSTAETFKTKIIQLGANNVNLWAAISSNAENQDFASNINQANKFVFLNNQYNTLTDFLNSTNGQLLRNKIRENNKIIAFVGDNSRFAGAYVVNQYLTSGASYYGELTFSEGLNLLKTTILMPNTFLESDIFENTVTAVPYGMVKYSLKYGVWLANKTFLKYFPENGKTYFTAYGVIPAMLLKNNGTYTDFASQISDGNTNYEPRQIAGFYNMSFYSFDNTKILTVGNEIVNNLDNRSAENLEIELSPNPVTNYLNIKWNDCIYSVKVYNASGHTIYESSNNNTNLNIDTQNYTTGVYLVQLTNSKKTKTLKFVK